MNTTGTITLPNGQTIEAGQGATYRIGSDAYPVTILGWSKSGNTIYYRQARWCWKSDDYVDNPAREVEVATWRKPARWNYDRGNFYQRYGRCGYITTDGYEQGHDPSF